MGLRYCRWDCVTADGIALLPMGLHYCRWDCVAGKGIVLLPYEELPSHDTQRVTQAY
jgi:hypothetical protein